MNLSSTPNIAGNNSPAALRNTGAWQFDRRATELWGYCTTSGHRSLEEAARRMSLTINAPRIEGFGGKSIGTTAVTCDGRKYWLKVSGLIGYSRNRSREGEIEAESLQEIPKPAVVRSCEWIDGNVYWRAVLQSLAPSPAIARMPWL